MIGKDVLKAIEDGDIEAVRLAGRFDRRQWSSNTSWSKTQSQLSAKTKPNLLQQIRKWKQQQKVRSDLITTLEKLKETIDDINKDVTITDKEAAGLRQLKKGIGVDGIWKLSEEGDGSVQLVDDLLAEDSDQVTPAGDEPRRFLNQDQAKLAAWTRSCEE